MGKQSLTGIGSGIGATLFPKIRRKVLALFLLNPGKQFYFREVVRILGDSPGSLLREIRALTRAGILEMEPIGVQKFYRINTANPIFKELKSIAEKTFGMVDIFRDVLGKFGTKIRFACIYGSVAKAEDTVSSDIDLMVIGSVTFRELVSSLQPIEENLQRSINPTLYTAKEFKKKLRDKNNFICNLINSEMLFIIGDKIDFAELVK